MATMGMDLVDQWLMRQLKVADEDRQALLLSKFAAIHAKEQELKLKTVASTKTKTAEATKLTAQEQDKLNEAAYLRARDALDSGAAVEQKTFAGAAAYAQKLEAEQSPENLQVPSVPVVEKRQKAR